MWGSVKNKSRHKLFFCITFTVHRKFKVFLFLSINLMTIFTKTDGNSITLKKWSHLWKYLLMHSWHEFLMFIADWYVCILKSFLNRSSLSAEEVHWDVDWWTASPPLAGWGHTTRRSICRERRASFIPSVHKCLRKCVHYRYISHIVNCIKICRCKKLTKLFNNFLSLKFIL